MELTYEQMSQAWAIKAALAELDATGPIEEWGEEVLNLFDGKSYMFFRTLDEKPGRFGYEHQGKEWHWKLRRVRNHPTMGKRLFDGLYNDYAKRAVG